MRMTPNRRVTRRALLGAFGGVIAGLAGCGYRAGGGEFRWRTGAFHRVDRMTLDRGTLLLVTREATSFDVRTDQWSDGGNVTTVDPERGEHLTEYGFEAPTLTATLGENALYAGGEDGTVTAVPLERDTGDAPVPATPEPDGWTTATGVAPSGVGAVAVADGATNGVYAGGSGGLASLSTDGEVRWRWRDGRVLAAAPGEDDVAVYVLARDRLVALAADGSVRWDHETTPTDAEGDRPVPPLVGAEGVYHASADGTVRSFSLDGHERWANDPRGTLTSRVAAAGGRAFVLAGGELVGVDGEGTAWRVPLDEPEPFAPEFGPFAVGEAIVLGSPGEVRGYWRSQLPR